MFHLYDITQKIRDTADRMNGLERPKPNEGYALRNGISNKRVTSSTFNVKQKYSVDDSNDMRGEDIFEATINIVNGKRGKIIYDVSRVHWIDNVKNSGEHTTTGDSQRSRYQKPEVGRTQSAAFDDTIAETGGNVKYSFDGTANENVLAAERYFGTTYKISEAGYIELAKKYSKGGDTYDVVHSVSGRQKRSKQAGSKSPQSIRSSMLAFNNSIANFLDVVNSTYQSILSEDVLENLEETRNPNGYYSGRVRYSIDDEYSDYNEVNEYPESDDTVMREMGAAAARDAKREQKQKESGERMKQSKEVRTKSAEEEQALMASVGNGLAHSAVPPTAALPLPEGEPRAAAPCRNGQARSLQFSGMTWFSGSATVFPVIASQSSDWRGNPFPRRQSRPGFPRGGSCRRRKAVTDEGCRAER